MDPIAIYLAAGAIAVLGLVVLAYWLYDPRWRCASHGHAWCKVDGGKRMECERCGAWRVHANAFGLAHDDWFDFDEALKAELESTPEPQDPKQ